MRIIIALGVLAVAGCAASVSSGRIATLEAAVSAAETLALNYTRLPACPAVTLVCADPARKAKLKAEGQTAHDAVTALRRAPAGEAQEAYALASAALAALVADTPAAH